jgi:hypothetical protein
MRLPVTAMGDPQSFEDQALRLGRAIGLFAFVVLFNAVRNMTVTPTDLKLPAPSRVWTRKQVHAGSAPMSNVSSAKPWSTLDLQNLREGLRAGMPILKLADFLIRDVDEVEAKIAELAANQSGGQQTPPTI